MQKPKFELFEILILISATLLLALYFYELRQVLIPPVLAIILVLFFLPFRDQAYARRLIYIVLGVFAIWFIRDTLALLAPFAFAFALSYLFDPLVTKLERRGIRRSWSVATIVIVTLGLMAVAFVYSVPRIITELRNLLAFILELPPRVAEWLQRDGAELFGGSQSSAAKLQEILNREVPLRLQKFSDSMLQTLLDFPQTVPMLLSKAIYLILIPFLFFYILKDFYKIKRWIKEALPIETSWVVKEYVEKIDDIIAGFFRGQFIVCSIVGVLTSLILLAFGINYALLLGILAGAMNIVPYVGLAITLFVGLIIGIASPHPIMTCAKIIVAIEGVRIIEGSLLSPRIVGNRVGLHPVWVIFSILVFSHFLGLVGLILAVPIAATIKIFISVYMHKYRRRIWRRKK